MEEGEGEQLIDTLSCHITSCTMLERANEFRTKKENSSSTRYHVTSRHVVHDARESIRMEKREGKHLIPSCYVTSCTMRDRVGEWRKEKESSSPTTRYLVALRYVVHDVREREQVEEGEGESRGVKEGEGQLADALSRQVTSCRGRW